MVDEDVDGVLFSSLGQAPSSLEAPSVASSSASCSALLCLPAARFINLAWRRYKTGGRLAHVNPRTEIEGFAKALLQQRQSNACNSYLFNVVDTRHKMECCNINPLATKQSTRQLVHPYFVSTARCTGNFTQHQDYPAQTPSVYRYSILPTCDEMHY